MYIGLFLLYNACYKVAGIAITVFVGHTSGLCDLNMILISGETLEHYIGPNGEFLIKEVSLEAWKLPLYYFVPRSLICLTITLSCSAVSRIVRNNIRYAQEWEEAEKSLGHIDTIPVSASYGYAYGKGAELASVIQQADAMMYENKRRFHNENKI